MGPAALIEHRRGREKKDRERYDENFGGVRFPDCDLFRLDSDVRPRVFRAFRRLAARVFD